MAKDLDKYYLQPDDQELVGASRSSFNTPSGGVEPQVKQEMGAVPLPPQPQLMVASPAYMGGDGMMGYPMQFEYPYSMEHNSNHVSLQFQDFRRHETNPSAHGSVFENSMLHQGTHKENMFRNQALPTLGASSGSQSPESFHSHGPGNSKNRVVDVYKKQASADFHQHQMVPRHSPGPHADIASQFPKETAPYISEVELRKLAAENMSLPLSELAASVRAIDNDDSSLAKTLHSTTLRDKNRDIFATNWLLRACEASTTAVVPRNRIYARYVLSCANFGLVPITPTNMGKLVKMLFPGLSIRRLGVRGRSKYHYNGIRLVEEPEDSFKSLPTHQLSPPDSPHSAPSINSPVDLVDVSQVRTPTSVISAAAELLDMVDLNYVPGVVHQVDQLLDFEDMSTPIKLPSIYPYLPPDTDGDIADTLYALYTIHCTTVLEGMRYLQTKRLFQSFSTLNTILTAPVKTLYSSESVGSWIHRCDLLVYNKMAKMLNRVYLRPVPPPILQRLKDIADNLIQHLSDSLRNKMHKEFISSKIKSALKFVSILTRMIAVIQTRDLAARYLRNQDSRRAMLESWQVVNVQEMVEHLVPCQERTSFLLHILVNEVLNILSSSTDAVADCANLVAELPSRFPEPNLRFYLVTAGSLLTALLIETGLHGGTAKDAWYAVICWVDEFMKFCLELGGYFSGELDPGAASRQASQNDSSMAGDDTDRNESLISELTQVVDLLDKSYGADKEQNFDEMFYNVEDILQEGDLQ